MPFSQLTIVSVTGAEAYTEGSMWAIARSCKELPGAKGLLISPNRPTNLPDFIEHQPCKPFGYVEYSIFMTYSLAQYIHTDYCLVVQNDGWVLNGKNWQECFWDYDYIGAPIITYYAPRKDARGQHYFTTHASEMPDDYRVLPQNGGFSLRSKRFLTMPRELGIAMMITPPNIIPNEQPFRFDWGSTPVHSEDLFLTVTLRQQLEQAGIRFAPFDVANQFSFESLTAPISGNMPLQNYLGHHFFINIQITGLNSIKIDWPAHHFQNENWARTKQILDMFQQLGYHAEILLRS